MQVDGVPVAARQLGEALQQAARQRVLEAGAQAAVLLLDRGAAADAEAYFEERLRIAN